MERRGDSNQQENSGRPSRWEPFYDRDRDPNYQDGMRFRNLYTGPYATSLSLNRPALERFSAIADLPPIHLRNGVYQKGNQRPDINSDGSMALKSLKAKPGSEHMASLWSVRYVADHWMIDIDGSDLRDRISRNGPLSKWQEAKFTMRFELLLRKSLHTILSQDKLGPIHAGDMHFTQSFGTAISSFMALRSFMIFPASSIWIGLAVTGIYDFGMNVMINEFSKHHTNVPENLRDGTSVLLPPLPVERWLLGRTYLKSRMRLIK